MSDSDSDNSSTGSLEAAGPSAPDFLPLRTENRSGYQPLSRYSDTRIPQVSGFEDTSPSDVPRPSAHRHRHHSHYDQSPEADSARLRHSIMAMDRKRRLTSSAHENERRRHTPSDFYTRHPAEHSSSAAAMSLQQNVSNDSPSRREVVDLTGSSPPPPASPLRHPVASRTSSSSSRRYVVPRWQPDSEVTECPICKRAFTFIFRRHHCRKCGRVVCNDCSPHRITIPRQFIVSSPGLDMPSSPIRTTTLQSETIDLTGDDDDLGAASRRHRNSATPLPEGGEKVRLCNPCVPDPQPEPLPNFPPLQEEESASHALGPRLATGLLPGHPSVLSTFARRGQHGGFGISRFGPANNDNSSTYTSSGSLYTSRPRPNSMTNPYPGRFPFSTSPNADLPRPFNNPLPPLPRNAPSSHSFGHSRFSSMDTNSRGSQPQVLGRPRISSLIEAANGPSMPPHPSHRTNPEHGVRPRINEEDMCPVCRRALPERGPNGDETGREAHIMACISARDPNATGDAGSSSRGMLHMITFSASEKDCVGEDGNVQECSICMEEYDVGDGLARLECWCKFHKRCIVSWLHKKAECPVHKASAMHYM